MNKRPWLVTLVNTLTPDLDSVPNNMKHRVAELISFWRTLIPEDSMDGCGDLEDFIEQALRLNDCISIFGPENVYYTINNSRAIHAASGAEVEVNGIREQSNRYGVIYKHHDMFNDSYVVDADKADAYMSTETFRKNAGRRVQLCSTDMPGNPNIIEVLKDFYNEGKNDFVVKVARSKKGLWFFSLDDKKLADLDNYLLDIMDWSLVSFGGIKDAFLVQEKIPMHYEYRLFVVNNQVVTGAGCIEEFSPFNNNGLIFDDSIRKDRQLKSAVEKNPEIVDRLVSFGKKVAKEFAAEQPEVKNYVLDVAVDEHGSPLMIERNSYPNAGYYACQSVRIVEALAETYSTVLTD